MSWFTKLINGRSGPAAKDPDYYEEGSILLREEKFHEALTSFRLALRESPNDTDVLLQIAVTYTRIGMTADEALSVVLMTVPDGETGERIARALVEERLIACANLLPGVTSVYRWEGE